MANLKERKTLQKDLHRSLANSCVTSLASLLEEHRANLAHFMKMFAALELRLDNLQTTFTDHDQ